ncbi:hypothetical protein P153DRAFT_297094, partial [Dothidotthia symphoricarpi CBS 119687]
MGLFSSNKPPQPPLPTLTIHLYSPAETVFKPNDQVSGHVILTPIESINPRAVEVSLFGQSLVWLRTSHSSSNNHTSYYHFRDNAPLFEVTTDVLLNHDLQAGQVYTFPFSFRFPEGTGNSRVASYKKSDDARWTVGPHNLPPSFFHGSKYAHDLDDADFAKIEYG